MKLNGRLGVVSLSKDNGKSLFLRLYEWAHIKFPKYIDCRPIFVTKSIKDASFDIGYKESKDFSSTHRDCNWDREHPNIKI